MIGLITVHGNLKDTYLHCGLVNSPRCDRFKQASEMALHLLCEREALTTVRLRHLHRHSKKPLDFEDISISRIRHFVEGAWLLGV